MLLKEYYGQLRSVKKNDFDNKFMEVLIELIKNFCDELICHAKKDIRIYTECQLKYILYSFLYYSYNETLLQELTSLKKEAKYQHENLRKIKALLRRNQNDILLKTAIYETVLDIATLQIKRREYFKHLAITDTMKFKNITYIPSSEVPTSNKELMKKIDDSLNALLKR